jgi:hypothetical protein
MTSWYCLSMSVDDLDISRAPANSLRQVVYSGAPVILGKMGTRCVGDAETLRGSIVYVHLQGWGDRRIGTNWNHRCIQQGVARRSTGELKTWILTMETPTNWYSAEYL